MKKNQTNVLIKILGMTLIAVSAMFKTSYCQTPSPGFDVNTYSLSVSSHQQAKLRLPLDIRTGDVISGTVTEENKNNSGEVSKASSTLQGVVIEINGKQTKLSDRIISFLVPAGVTALPFLLKNAAGQVIDQGQIPVIELNPTLSAQEIPANGTAFSPDVIGQPGQTLSVNGLFDGNALNTKVLLAGQPCEVIAESPRGCFADVPQNASSGVSNLTIEENNRKEEHKMNVLTLDLNADKTSLHRGGKATITVTVKGLENLDLAKNDFKIQLENRSPQTISFLNENNNVIVKDIQAGVVKNGVYEFSTRILAQTTGMYEVNVLLLMPKLKKTCKQNCDDICDECIKKAQKEYDDLTQALINAANGDGHPLNLGKSIAPLVEKLAKKKEKCEKIKDNCEIICIIIDQFIKRLFGSIR